MVRADGFADASELSKNSTYKFSERDPADAVNKAETSRADPRICISASSDSASALHLTVKITEGKARVSRKEYVKFPTLTRWKQLADPRRARAGPRNEHVEDNARRSASSATLINLSSLPFSLSPGSVLPFRACSAFYSRNETLHEARESAPRSAAVKSGLRVGGRRSPTSTYLVIRIPLREAIR